MNVQVNAKSAAKSVLEFVKQSGGSAKNTEALELVARICGFDSYRAMRAVSQRDQVPSKGTTLPLNARLIESPGRVAFRSPMTDWEWDENRDADLDFIPERRRTQFELVLEDCSPQFRVSIRPVGVDLDTYHGKPILDLQLEINDGVPCVHFSNDPSGEMLMSVFGTGPGLVIRQDTESHVRLAKASAPLYELAHRNGAEYLSDTRFSVVENDTFMHRTHTDMLVTAIAEDASKAAKSTDSVNFAFPLSPPVTHPVDEAIADLSEAKDPTMRDDVVHVQFDDCIEGPQAWLDVCFVGPDGSSEVSESIAGYTSFGKKPSDRPARLAFVTASATVAAYFTSEGQHTYLNQLIREVMVRPNALELMLKCQEIVTRSKAYSVHLACDAVEALLAVLPTGLVLVGHAEGCDTVVCRHCDGKFSLKDDGVKLGMVCPAQTCPSHTL